MKKRFCLMLLICTFITFILPNPIYGERKTDHQLLSDTLITLLYPAITEAIENYYGYSKAFDLFEAKILGITRAQEGSFTFTVKVQVTTFKEAHNPPYGKETIFLEVKPGKVRILTFIHKGDEYEKTIVRFYDKVISDIKDTFSLNLDAFKMFTYDQLLFKAEKQKDFQSLSSIVSDILKNEINPDIKTPYTPYKNVINPVTFIHGNQGYILYKKANGTNYIVEISKSNHRWVAVNKQRKQGKKMRNELLWYM